MLKKNLQIEKKEKIVKINEKGTYKVQSATDLSKWYTVKFIDGCPVFCDCMNFQFMSRRNPNYVCKHQRKIIGSETIVIKGLSYLRDEYSY